VQNCEDLLYHAAETQEAATWHQEEVSVLSGHYDAIASKLKAKVRMPTIVFSCRLLQKLKEPHYREAMGNVTASDFPILVFDEFIWWRPGPLFTFEPPFEAIKFPKDPTVKTTVKKTKDDVGGQDRLDGLANAQQQNPGTKIEKGGDGTILSVTIEKPQNLGNWKKECKKFYQEAESSQTNPFQCAQVATPSFQLASFAAALKAKIDDGSVTSGLWLVDYAGTGGSFTLHRNGGLTVNPVEIEVATA